MSFFNTISNLFGGGGFGGGVSSSLVEDPKLRQLRQQAFRRNLMGGLFNLGGSLLNRRKRPGMRMIDSRTGIRPPDYTPSQLANIRRQGQAWSARTGGMKYNTPINTGLDTRTPAQSGTNFSTNDQYIRDMQQQLMQLSPIGQRGPGGYGSYDPNKDTLPDTNRSGEVVGPGDVIKHRIPISGTPGDPLYGMPAEPAPFKPSFDPSSPVYNPDGSLASDNKPFDPNSPVYNPDGSLAGGNEGGNIGWRRRLGMKPSPNPADVAGPPGSGGGGGGPYHQFPPPVAPNIYPFDPGPMRQPRMPMTMNMPLVPSVLRHLYPGGTGFGPGGAGFGYGMGGIGIGGGGGYPGANLGYGQGRRWHLPGPPAMTRDKDGNPVVRPPMFYDRIQTPYGDKNIERSLPFIGERLQGRWRADNRPPGGWRAEMMDRGHMPIRAGRKAQWDWREMMAGILRGAGKNMGEGRWSNANVGRGAIAGLLGDMFGSW